MKNGAPPGDSGGRDAMMNDKIGGWAGDIWRYLEAAGQGPVAVITIKTTLSLPSRAVYLALGWLARENKIVIEGKGNDVLVSLKK